MKTLIVATAALLALGSWARAGEEEKAAFPLSTCVVSGDTLGEHGDAVVYKYQGREVRFCCEDCVKDFNKDPQKYLKMLDDAAVKSGKENPQEAHSEHQHHDDAK